MLVLPFGDGALAIGQLSHSWLSGQLARAWGNERFPEPEPHEDVALGAEQHDIGWALADLDPPFDEQTGLPQAFLRTDVARHLSIWRDAPDRLLTQSLHAALVVSLHASALSELRARSIPADASKLQPHIDAEHARQRELRARLGLSEEQTQRTQRQMWTWDSLSLALCHGWQPFTVKDVPAAEGLLDVELRDLGSGTWSLDPWPLAAGRLDAVVEGRLLAAHYQDESEMRAGLRDAQPRTLRFTLVAP